MLFEGRGVGSRVYEQFCPRRHLFWMSLYSSFHMALCGAYTSPLNVVSPSFVQEVQWQPSALKPLNCYQMNRGAGPLFGAVFAVALTANVHVPSFYYFWIFWYLKPQMGDVSRTHLHCRDLSLYVLWTWSQRTLCHFFTRTLSVSASERHLCDPSSPELDLVCPGILCHGLTLFDGSHDSSFLVLTHGRQSQCFLDPLHCSKENHQHLEGVSVAVFTVACRYIPEWTPHGRQARTVSRY